MVTWIFEAIGKKAAAAAFYTNEIRNVQKTIDPKTIRKISGNPMFFVAPGRAKFLKLNQRPSKYWAYTVGGLAQAYNREQLKEKQKQEFEARLKLED
jgi:hypothetical protein